MIKEDKKPASQFSKMLAEGDFIKVPKVGEIIKGQIIDIAKSEIRIDLEGLTTGVIRGREFYDESSEYGGAQGGETN